MITCRTVSKLHTASREGALTGTQRLRYELHMRICPGCKQFKSQLDTTVQVLGGLTDEEPSDALLQALAGELPKRDTE